MTSLWSWRPPEDQPASLREESTCLPWLCVPLLPARRQVAAGAGAGPHEFTMIRLRKLVLVRIHPGGEGASGTVQCLHPLPSILRRPLPKPCQPGFQEARLLSTRTLPKQHLPPIVHGALRSSEEPWGHSGEAGRVLADSLRGRTAPWAALHPGSPARWPLPLWQRRTLILSPYTWAQRGDREEAPVLQLG